MFVEPSRIATAIGLLQAWASERGLERSERPYPPGSHTSGELRFSAAGDPELDRAYKTHWLGADVSKAERERLIEREARRPDLVVIKPLKDFTCSVCETECAGLLIMENPGPVCMPCADMDHLVFLASGDAALTRRARAASRLPAIVVRFSRARKRYERQGILVEEEALDRAEAECLADEQARARRRERDALRRAEQDLALQERMADDIGRRFPGCPRERALQIARHTAARGSGRVGRSAAGRALQPDAIELAVIASVRHGETRYDELLMSGVARQTARAQVYDDVASTLDGWRAPPLTSPHTGRATGVERWRRRLPTPPDLPHSWTRCSATLSGTGLRRRWRRNARRPCRPLLCSAASSAEPACSAAWKAALRTPIPDDRCSRRAHVAPPVSAARGSAAPADAAAASTATSLTGNSHDPEALLHR